MNEKNIFEKLFNVKKAWIKLQRDTKAFNYKYATLDQIQTKLGSIFEAERLLVLHNVRDWKVVTKIYNLDNLTEYVESSIVMSEWVKAQDKWSEITYYRRYNLLCLLDLEVEDDDWEKASWKTVKKQTENTEEDKPWFNDEQYDQLFENIDKFKDGDDAVKKARIKYKVSKIMEKKIRDLFFE